jgi:hypothetical protein
VKHPQYVEALSELVLIESNHEATVDVVLMRGGNLEGRVVDARGRPVASAHVTALASRGSLEHVTRTSADGSFAFASLPEAITLLVSRDEDLTTVAARVEVSIPEASRKNVTITLPDPRPALTVRVTDARGRDLEAAQVTASSLDPSETLRVTGFTDGRGRTELAGAKGLLVRLEVRAPGHAPRVVSVPPDASEFTVALSPAESVTGEVLTRRREPLTGAEITLRMDGAVRNARTDKAGAFVFGELSPGPATLHVKMVGRAPADRELVIEERGGRRPTEMPRIELAEEGRIEGIVVDGRGEPVPGARIAKDAVPTYLPVGASTRSMTTSDARGRFSLGELPEGSLSFEAFAADIGRGQVRNVSVSAGRTSRDVRIVIQREDRSERTREPLATGGVAVTLGEATAGLETPEVILVAVTEGSEAERAGLAVGDVLVEVAGVRVTSLAEARARLSGSVRDDVLVNVRRGERSLVLRVPREPVRR